MSKKRIISFIFIGLVALTGVTTIINYHFGTIQDAKFKKDAEAYDIIQSSFEQGDYKSAQIYIRDLLPTHPDSEVLLWNYAVCLVSFGQYTEAMEYYDRLHKVNPAIIENPDYLNQYGFLLNNAGQSQRAQKYFERVQQLAKKP